ncbi:MAG TPA: hypothetical protein VK886_06710 [Vicinamibacterales bacterium]|nr:hypothetical protein [Vicinamibacterales bacterium]
MSAEIQKVILGFIQGLGVSVVVVLAVIAGFCVLVTLPKLRPTGRKSLVIKSLDERVGEPIHFLPPDAPTGTVDQLAAGTRRAAQS